MGTYPPFMPGLPGVTLFNDFSGLYRPTASNADLDRLYSTSVAIYAAANFWGSTASLVKWKILDKDGQEVTDIPEAQALRHNMPDLLHRSMISEKFRGYNLLYKEPSFNRHVYRLRWMNFNQYMLDEHFQDGLRGWRVMQSGTNYEPIDVAYIRRDEGVYWNLIDLQDDFDGVAPAEVAFMYAGVDVEAGTTMLAYFQNMAIPALFIQPAADGKIAPSAEEATKLTTLFRKIVKGAMNFGRTIISPARWEIQQVQSKMEDLKMGELIATAREAVRIAMDVPTFVLSSEGTSYAESYEERRQWLNLSFVPHMNKIGRYFEDQLIRPLYPEYTVAADYADVPGMKEEAERLTTTIAAQVTSVTRDLFSAQEALGIEPAQELKGIYIVQGVPVPLADIPTFYAKMQAQGGLMGAMPPAPGFGGGGTTPVDPSAIPAGDNSTGAAPASPVGAASAKEAGTKSGAIMLGIGAHPELIALQNRVRELCTGQQVDWLTPDTFHVTVIHLPAIDDAQAALVRAYVNGLTVDPMALRIGSLGTFDTLGSYAIRFMIRSNTALFDLQEACLDFCEQNSIPVSHHSANYKPHITMGYSNINPGRLTYNTPLTVTPTSLQWGVDKAIAYERSLSTPAVNAVKSTVYAETAPLRVIDTLDDIWLDDTEFKELKQWRVLKARKGIEYPFVTNVLPVQSIAYGDGLLMQGYGVDAAFEAMKPHIVSMKKAALTTPDGEEISYDAWAEYDTLKDDIGDVWLNQYQQSVLDIILSTVDENGASVDALDKAFTRSQDDLVSTWTGTQADPGPLSRLLMAGVAAGDASLKQGSAANPQRPVALKSVDLAINWNLANMEAVDFIQRYALNLIKRLNKTTRDEVQVAIAKWLQEGGTMDDLRAVLSEVIQSPVRASMISETESTRAYFEGARERYKQADVKRIEWRTVNVGLKRAVKQPGDTCALCTPLHGKTGDVDKGVWSDALQSYATPPLHPRCRCWVVAADEDML